MGELDLLLNFILWDMHKSNRTVNEYHFKLNNEYISQFELKEKVAWPEERWGGVINIGLK